ncbi:hypothetical protein Bbelb_219890 [Branchiostoma belcheri]|nr:hypothetical protein Bbelb_219890 [Branchiostoma belcheri]
MFSFGPHERTRKIKTTQRTPPPRAFLLRRLVQNSGGERACQPRLQAGLPGIGNPAADIKSPTEITNATRQTEPERDRIHQLYVRPGELRSRQPDGRNTSPYPLIVCAAVQAGLPPSFPRSFTRDETPRRQSEARQVQQTMKSRGNQFADVCASSPVPDGARPHYETCGPLWGEETPDVT